MPCRKWKFYLRAAGENFFTFRLVFFKECLAENENFISAPQAKNFCSYSIWSKFLSDSFSKKGSLGFWKKFSKVVPPSTFSKMRGGSNTFFLSARGYKSPPAAVMVDVRSLQIFRGEGQGTAIRSKGQVDGARVIRYTGQGWGQSAKTRSKQRNFNYTWSHKVQTILE